VRFGTPGQGSGQWSFFAALRRGLFDAQGLDVDLSYTRSEPLAMQYLVSGSLDVAHITPGPVLTVDNAGADAIMIGGTQNKTTWTLIGRPEIQRLADLRGKTVGTDQVRGTIPALTKALIAPSGLVPEQDYDLRPLGSQAERYAALVANQVAAGLLMPPVDTRARDEGYTVLGSTLADLPPLQWTVFVVDRAWASANADVLVRFLTAVRQGATWVYDPANRAAAIELLANEFNVDEGIIARDYTFMIEETQALSRDASFDRQGVQRYLELFVAEGLIPEPTPPLERYADLSYWETSRSR
jgi:NitT/TauT family transport system substrate-binding protein